MEHPKQVQAESEEAAPRSAVRQSLDHLIESSPFTRADRGEPTTTIEIGERKFTISAIESGEHPDIDKVQNLLIKTFGEEEVDPKEILQVAVEGRNRFGDPEIKYRVHVIKDEEGNAVSMVAGGLLNLRDEKGGPTQESVFMVGYAVTDENARQGGLAREAYISAIMDAERMAKEQGTTLAFAAGECTSTSENFWNRVGWKRVYGEAPDDPKSLREVEYVQPALDFDPATGLPTEDAGEAAEHLMIHAFDGRQPTKDELVATIRAFYKWCNVDSFPRQHFESDAAKAAHVAYVREFETAFRDKLEALGAITLLDKSTREAGRGAGAKIEDYAAADENGAGEEDF